MKTKLMLVMAVISLGMLAVAPPEAAAQAVTMQVHTNLASVTNNTLTQATGITGTRIYPNEPSSIWVQYSAANPGTSNMIWGFDLSPDNVTWSTAQPLKATNAVNGTNTVITRFQYTANETGGARYIRLGSVSTTQTNAVTTAKVWYVPWR